MTHCPLVVDDSRVAEQSVSVTDLTHAELDADVAAQADHDDLGASVEADEDTDIAELEELSIQSPFGDLIKDLYALVSFAANTRAGLAKGLCIAFRHIL